MCRSVAHVDVISLMSAQHWAEAPFFYRQTVCVHTFQQDILQSADVVGYSWWYPIINRLPLVGTFLQTQTRLLAPALVLTISTTIPTPTHCLPHMSPHQECIAAPAAANSHVTLKPFLAHHTKTPCIHHKMSFASIFT